MTDAVSEMTGACLCGAISVSGKPKLESVGVCHCDMCRKWSAGPYMAATCDDISLKDEGGHLGVYKSSEWAERGFCKNCGTSLFWRLHDGTNYVVSAELFENKGVHHLDHQIFVDEQPSYYEFANKTHTMTGPEVFAMFSGEGGEK